LEANVALANGLHERIRATHQLESRQAAYNRLVGRPLERPVSLEPLTRPPDRLDLDSLTRIAMECRPEIARIEARIKAAQQEAAGIAAGKHPQVVCWAITSSKKIGLRKGSHPPQCVSLGMPSTRAGRGRRPCSLTPNPWRERGTGCDPTLGCKSDRHGLP
jgi:hypothetical protein